MADWRYDYGDTRFTKIFVGGLAWRTRGETLRHHFEHFGEILEAVVIRNKYTGRSRGFGFVTFREQVSARMACENPRPVIDGRRANCNLAFLGANKHHSYPVQVANVRPAPHNRYPFSPAGLSAHSQEYQPMTYLNVQMEHQQPPYHPSGTETVYLNYYQYQLQDQQGSSSGRSQQYPKFLPVTVVAQQFQAVPAMLAPSTVELPAMAAARASKSGRRRVGPQT